MAKLGRGSLTVDGRIVLSENLISASVRNFLTSRGFTGIGGGRFFINGVDMVFNHPFALGQAGKLDLTVVGNYTKTDVTRVPVTEQLAALSPAPVLFERVNVLTFEQGTPKTKFSASGNWSMGPWGATLRATRYGKILTPVTSAALDQWASAKVLVDLEARFAFSRQLSLAVGADNLFDQYPDPYTTAQNATGNAPFSNYSPFGRSGRFVYARMTYAFE